MNNQQQYPIQQQQQPAQKDDFLDKGLAMAQKKYGKGGPVDKQKNEKITDFIRKAFEKVFKTKVPSAISN